MVHFLKSLLYQFMIVKIVHLITFHLLIRWTLFFIYSARHIKWARMFIYVKLALYWNNFGPEKDPLGVLLLWLVLGGVPLPTDDFLQPPGHEFHQVYQGLSWVNLELGGVPFNACQKKVFKLRAMKFSQNMHKIHTDTKKKLQSAVTFRDKDIGFLTLIPTGEPTSGPHCFRAKYLGIFLCKKSAKNS
jgi:hypothetical protein